MMKSIFQLRQGLVLCPKPLPTQQRRDHLAGKKGIERMMAARSDDDDFLVYDNDQAHMANYIDCRFRMWNWKTQAQFKKWATEMEDILAKDHAKYTSESLKTKSLGIRKDQVFLAQYRLTKAFVQEEKKHYQNAVAGLTREWMLMCDGAVRGMRYHEQAQKFVCSVRYVSKRRANSVSQMKIDVDEAWMLDYYGKDVTEYVKEASRKAFDGFVNAIDEGRPRKCFAFTLAVVAVKPTGRLVKALGTFGAHAGKQKQANKR
jgi:hypothetical protein